MSNRVRAGLDHTQYERSSSIKWLLILLILGALTAGAWWLLRSPTQWDQAVRTLQGLTGQTQGTASAANSGSNEPVNFTPLDSNSSTEHDSQADASSQEPPADLLALTEEDPQNPIEIPAETAATPLPALDASDSAVNATINQWVGKQQAAAVVQNNRLIRRIVATVDNLPTQRASAQLWPVHPTTPKFTVATGTSGTDTHIDPLNDQRYAAAIQMAKSMDAAQASQYYKQYYPLFQQAYEDLGYPNRYFNDRLITVIDHLLQAPERQAPRVRLVEVRGEIPSEQPWVHYEFEDPALEALSAGQKILVRVGPENARILKTKLREFRSQIATGEHLNTN